jgi:hypothetical protein
VGELKYVYFPVDRIKPYMQRAINRYTSNGVALRLAYTYGTNPESESRQLDRVMGGETILICCHVVDKWALWLGFHPVNIYPEWLEEERWWKKTA